MMNLNCQMVFILCQIFKIISITSLKNVYNNRINNRLVFKIRDGHKLELQTPETMKLFSSTKKINRKNEKWRKRTKS